MRIGHGYDVHAFEKGGRLVLGGVEIPHHSGLAAHSDGDVVLHALCDALLGAAALGDIGIHFPDSDSKFQNIDSRILLRRVGDLVNEQGLMPINIDVTIIAQAPRLSGFLAKMAENIARDLSIATNQVNLKATTTERLGYIGREEGIAAQAVVLIDHQG